MNYTRTTQQGARGFAQRLATPSSEGAYGRTRLHGVFTKNYKSKSVEGTS